MRIAFEATPGDAFGKAMAPTLPEAYATIVRRAARLKGYRVGGLPCIEVYRTTCVDANHEMNHTEIYIPVSRIRK